ncbi:MAG: type II toxin-antitoxin system mRNA interferase toxin, RelE/StbE family [bacterium]|nr:type II toxin-antitoxin system mRNA interferase toxin, RelE/StbE family [bacterium]
MPRKINGVKYSLNFLKHFSRLPRKIAEKAKDRELIFREDAFDSRLRTHKLHGKKKDVWAFWVDYVYRIKFIFLENEHILFLDIGTHDDVYR